jgi:hypothetical protein
MEDDEIPPDIDHLARCGRLTVNGANPTVTTFKAHVRNSANVYAKYQSSASKLPRLYQDSALTAAARRNPLFSGNRTVQNGVAHISYVADSRASIRTVKDRRKLLSFASLIIQFWSS